jgi:hypothetical protein
MFISCDVISAWEDAGIGGLVVAIIAGLIAWWKHKSRQPAVR